MRSELAPLAGGEGRDGIDPAARGHAAIRGLEMRSLGRLGFGSQGGGGGGGGDPAPDTSASGTYFHLGYY